MAVCMRRSRSIASWASVGRSGRARQAAQVMASTVATMGMSHQASADTPQGYDGSPGPST